MKGWRPESVVGPPVAAIEHHAPPIRRGDNGTVAVANIEDLNAHKPALHRTGVTAPARRAGGEVRLDRASQTGAQGRKSPPQIGLPGSTSRPSDAGQPLHSFPLCS